MNLSFKISKYLKILTENIHLRTKGNCDIINITSQVQEHVYKSNLTDGNALIFVIGSTASITTLEYEPGLKKDIPEILDRLIPSDRKYHHNNTWGDNNGHSHIRAAIVGCSKNIPFANRELLLGTWQQIVLIDFDEKSRERKVVIQLTGE